MSQSNVFPLQCEFELSRVPEFAQEEEDLNRIKMVVAMIYIFFFNAIFYDTI